VRLSMRWCSWLPEVFLLWKAKTILVALIGPAPYRHFATAAACSPRSRPEASTSWTRALAPARRQGGSHLMRGLRPWRAAASTSPFRRREVFRLMFVSGLLTDDQPRDPELARTANANYVWFKGFIAGCCTARDDKSVAAAALAFWSALHGFALLRMGGGFKRFMLGALTGDELANAMVAATVAIVPSIQGARLPLGRAPRDPEG
jgi:hypothetical protein